MPDVVLMSAIHHGAGPEAGGWLWDYFHSLLQTDRKAGMDAWEHACAHACSHTYTRAQTHTEPSQKERRQYL